MKLLIYIALLLGITISDKVFGLNYETYTMKNGVTLILNKTTQMQVDAALVCRTQSFENSGKSLYYNVLISKLIQNGTNQLGTSDFENERIHNYRIEKLFDQLNTAKKREQIIKLRKDIEVVHDSASKYRINGEASILLQNSGITSKYDCDDAGTTFTASFTNDMLEKWLFITTHQLSNPVFRNFDKEKYSIVNTILKSKDKNDELKQVFQKYAFNVSGKNFEADIKAIELTNLVSYYKQNFIASNMCLIISGDINFEETKMLVENSFTIGNDLQLTKTNAQAAIPASPSKGNYTSELKSKAYIFKPLELSAKNQVISNVIYQLMIDNRQGLLTPFYNSNDLKAFNFTSRVYNNRIYPIFMFYDKVSDKLLKQGLKMLCNGNFSDSTLLGLKRKIEVSKILSLENQKFIVGKLANSFINNFDQVADSCYSKILNEITKTEIQEFAKMNFSNWIATYNSSKVPVFKNQFNIETDTIFNNKKSVIACQFDSIPKLPLKNYSVDYDLIRDSVIAKGVMLNYNKNSENNVFSLKFTFNPSEKIVNKFFRIKQELHFELVSPKNSTLNEFNSLMSSLGSTYTFQKVENKEFGLIINGIDENFQQTIDLTSKLLNEVSIKKPEFKQLRNKYKVLFISGFPRKVDVDSLNKIYTEAFSSLTQISYYGSMPYNNVKDSLITSIGLEKISSNNVKESNSVTFANSKGSPSVNASIYSKPCSKKDKIVIKTLREYIQLLMWNEVREKHGFAYAVNTWMPEPVSDSTSIMLGINVYTMPHQVIEVSNLVTRILKNLPSNETEFDKAKQIAKSSLNTWRPEFRNVIDAVTGWKRRGLTDDPLKTDTDGIDALTLSQMLEYYNNKFSKQSVKLHISGKKDEIGRKEFDKFKKEYEQ